MYEIITLGRTPSTACIEHNAICTDVCQMICMRVSESQLSEEGALRIPASVSANTRLDDDTCFLFTTSPPQPQSRVILSHYPYRTENQLITDTRHLLIGLAAQKHLGQPSLEEAKMRDWHSHGVAHRLQLNSTTQQHCFCTELEQAHRYCTSPHLKYFLPQRTARNGTKSGIYLERHKG
jgi:hypothetical protein